MEYNKKISGFAGLVDFVAMENGIGDTLAAFKEIAFAGSVGARGASRVGSQRCGEGCGRAEERPAGQPRSEWP